MVIQVIDSPQPALVAAKAKDLFSEGLRAAILYISPINLRGEKTVRRAHIDAIHAAGIDVGFVCEGWGGSDNFAHNDINAMTGQRDGTTCANYLAELGAPDGVGVYPTVDNDASPSQINNLCLPYFRNFREYLPAKFQLGAYGCGALLFALEKAGLITLPWLSNASGWSGYRDYLATGRSVIVQQRESRLLSIDIDPDALNPAMTEFGFWKADGSASKPAMPAPVVASPPPTPKPDLEPAIDKPKPAPVAAERPVAPPPPPDREASET